MKTILSIVFTTAVVISYGQIDTLIVVKDRPNYWDKVNITPVEQRRAEDSILSLGQQLLYFDAIDKYVDLLFEKDSSVRSFPDTFQVKNVYGNAQIICYSSKGKSKITNTYFNGQMHFMGQYSDGIGQLKSYCVKADWNPLRDQSTLVIRKYYQPIRQGKWEYYNIDGTKSKRVSANAKCWWDVKVAIVCSVDM